MIKYSDLYFRTDLWDKPIIWNWKEQVRHEANNHKTFKPKISYLEILSKDIPKDLKPKIKNELFNDIKTSEEKKHEERGSNNKFYSVKKTK